MKKGPLFFLLLFPVFLQAQSSLTDSLAGILKTAVSDSVKFGIYNTLIRKTVGADPDKALAFANEYLEFAQSKSNKKEEGQALNNIGICYRYKGEYGNALDYYRQA